MNKTEASTSKAPSNVPMPSSSTPSKPLGQPIAPPSKPAEPAAKKSMLDQVKELASKYRMPIMGFLVLAMGMYYMKCMKKRKVATNVAAVPEA